MDTENEAPTELRFAWRQRQQEIDDFIQHLPSEPISTALIVAQHAAGKSTTLLAHVSDLLQHDEAYMNTVIIYLVPSQVEVGLLEHYVASAAFKPETKAESCFSDGIAAAKVFMMSFGQAVKKFSKLAEISDQSGLLLVLDLEISPTTEGEILLGLAMEWAAARASVSSLDTKGHGLLLLSSYHSPRIHVGRVAVQISYDWDWFLRRSNINPAELLSELPLGAVMKIAQGSKHVSVAAQFPYSFPLAGLSDMVQPVMQTRDVTELEHLRELSWVHKAQVPDDVMFYRPESYVHKPLASGIDSLGPAMLADRYRTVIELVARWPGQASTEKPTRNPHDLHFLRDSWWTTRPKHGVYRLSEFGDNLRELWQQVPALEALDFQVVHLVVTAAMSMQNDGWSENLVRVAIRLAAIMSWAGQLCGKENPEEPQTLHELRAQCTGLGKTRAHLGDVWASLGIWQNAYIAKKISLELGHTATLGTVRFNGQTAVEVLDLIAALEEVVGFNATSDESLDTTLTDAEVDLLEDALLSSWIDQIAVYIRGQDMWQEAATVREIKVSDSGFLDPTRLSGEEYEYGCYAFYSSIAENGEGTFLRELTAVSQRATKVFAAKARMPFTEAIASKYPVDRRRVYADS
ncbi:hypothetical protein PG991_000027 [Apiospora marii]|uniref:Uncharacterized protein n=1 Tax=Apiospora marii TaxID=335849 RepID=A0ABR1T0Y4_9PEZI